MTIWKQTALLGLYTLTSTHSGTGQTSGAIDLPIARNAATGFPTLPATGIKGVLRDYARLDPPVTRHLFGPEIGTNDTDDGLSAGALAFTEGRLIAYPVRSLSEPFLHATCPLILEGLVRDLRATGATNLLPLALASEAGAGALVGAAAMAGKPLVLEDLFYAASEVTHSEQLEEVAKVLATLIPDGEEPTRQRFREGLVLIPDSDFRDLMESAVPVSARIKLTNGKTTDTWRDPDTGEVETGNLWYEEFLPSDCLFLALVGQRRARASNGKTSTGPSLTDLVAASDSFAVIQIGGNETVGHGLCLCTAISGRLEETTA